MPDRSFRFRWWYLLLLLPGVFYLGARWYLGHRIADAIATANADGNTLQIGAYSYGLFPLHVEASDLEFDQDRETFTARGRLARLEVGGLHLFSLVGADPLELNRIRVAGLDAEVHRTATGAQDSSGLRIEVEEIALDSINLTLIDEAKGQDIQLTDFALSLQSFHLPFQPAGLRSVRVTADSTVFADRTRGLRIAAAGIGYGLGTETIEIAELRVQRDSATDLRAERVSVAGLNAQDLEETLYIDSITVARLGGGARVGSGAEDSASATQSLQIGYVGLDDVDVQLTGKFGRAAYRGRLDARGLDLGDSVRVANLRVDGDSVRFDNGKGILAAVAGLTAEQADVRLPYVAGTLGKGSIRLPAFRLALDGRDITGDSLSYSSVDERLTTGRITFDSKEVSGKVDGISVTGVDRASLLTDAAATLAGVTARGVDVRVPTADGGHYSMTVPTLELADVRVKPSLAVAELELDGGSFVRYGSDGRADMRGSGIYVAQRTISLPFDAASLGASYLAMDRLRTMGTPELPVDYFFRGIVFDSPSQVVTLDSLMRVTQVSQEELFRRELAKSWMDFAFDRVRLTGIELDPVLSGELIRIDSLSAADFRLLVVEDMNISPSEAERKMPVEALRGLGPRVVLNYARFRSTDIAYGVVDSVMEPKTIHFGAGTITLAGLDTELSDQDSVLAVVDATFEETTPLHAEFRLGRGASGRDYSARGQLGAYDLSRVNPLMRIAADAVIETGEIEELTYQSSMRGDTIRGDLSLVYRNLDLKVVGGGSWIKNLLAGVVVKNDNQRGEDFRPGHIFHVHDPTKSFFNSYWKGLVSGMKSSALADIAVPEELE